MANIFEILSKNGNITPEKAHKSRQMQFHDKTAYVWGLRYRWDHSLSMNPVRRFAHFMPTWLGLQSLLSILLWQLFSYTVGIIEKFNVNECLLLGKNSLFSCWRHSANSAKSLGRPKHWHGKEIWSSTAMFPRKYFANLKPTLNS